ncbi:MerR family transcriptional regulator [Psychromonas sp. Urea-02u-13]|uniref:MerR family transcriptional regulator n=1 Tax=Psychromonas sp. Urea-02u-13 TaxID=2058326 RepID=UPI000C330953|nr:MerR family transcriptional regulator [Psychromonas sp. Urea-02u-13]PKG39666.1 methyltransferase [Psychromonas sp. Urea-02u-13]
MYQISQLAIKVGLSRTAILYYEKQQLIKGKRLNNGYRVYDDADVQRIRFIQQLQAGGLTLKECKTCLEEKIDRELLKNRLQVLDDEIQKKQQSRQLLAALLGEGNLNAWHEKVDKIAPEAHLNWLMKQGFNEKEALRLRWLSKNMNEHDNYMADFMTVFETLERWGPGDKNETLKALSLLPLAPKSILEIGCGKGIATSILADNTEANIVGVDNEQSVIDNIQKQIADKALSSNITAICASMTDLPFEKDSFDTIWAEGSAYIMGVENALIKWKPLLKQAGFLVLSDLVWLTDTISDEAKVFWDKSYPDIQSLAIRVDQIEKAGYDIVSSFQLSDKAWQNYVSPLKNRVEALLPTMPASKALQDINHEIDIYSQYLGEFGYQMFILKIQDKK